MQSVKSRNRRERGSTMIEFSLVIMLLVPLFISLMGLSWSLDSVLQATQVTRDAGHLFLDQVDLSLPQNQKIVGRLASGMGLASDPSGTINPSGSGVVIFTQVMKIGANECLAGGYPSPTGCPNYGDYVVTRRIVLGNASLRTSALGTPSPGILEADGTITPEHYTTDASVVVPNNAYVNLLQLPPGMWTYAVESFFNTPAMTGFGTNGVAAFNFF